MKKTLVAILLVATMLATLALPSFAADTTFGGYEGTYLDMDFDSAADLGTPEINDVKAHGMSHSVADGALKFYASEAFNGTNRYEVKIPVGGTDGVSVDTTKAFTVSLRFRMSNSANSALSYDSDLISTPQGQTTYGDGMAQVNQIGAFCVTQNGNSQVGNGVLKADGWHTVDMYITPGENKAASFVVYIDSAVVYDTTKLGESDNKTPFNNVQAKHIIKTDAATKVSYIRFNFMTTGDYNPTTAKATFELDYFRIGDGTVTKLPENGPTSDFTAAAVVLVAIATAGVVYTQKRR